MDEMLKLTNLTKSYGKSRGITDVSMSVNKGEIFGFLGPNGAGKSTTIRSIMGFIEPNSGSITLFGKEASKRNREELLSRIGYMPSESWFYPSMKVKEIIAVAAEARNRNCSDEAKRLCERLQVDENKRIRELSLGNRKKVSVVCAMQHKPDLLIFDEPTSGLDPLMQAEFFGLIHEAVEGGATCLLSTHVLSEVKNHCDRIGIMKEGKLLKVDTVENVLRSGVKQISMIRDGKSESFLYDGDLNDFYKELQGHNITELLVEDPSLEDMFMQYYE